MRKLLLSSALVLSSCGTDRVSEDVSWTVHEMVDMAHDMEPMNEPLDSEPDASLDESPVDLTEEITCVEGVLPASPDFERIEGGWSRIFDVFEREGAFYQAVLSIVPTENSERETWQVRLTQRMCVDGKARRAMWLPGSQSVLDGLPDDYPHLLRAGAFALVDDKAHVFAPSCLQLLNERGPVAEELIPYQAYISPGTWESLKSERTLVFDLSYPMSGWIDSDPRHMDTAAYYNEALDYEGTLGGRMYWPVLHREGFPADESDVTSFLSVCLETGWPLDPRGFSTSEVGQTYLIQDIPQLKLPEEVLSYLIEHKRLFAGD